ncbi:MAG: UDP-N-acetylmuramoyl-L-alanine--D-glutamate ligase [Anaerolineae bacterium]
MSATIRRSASGQTDQSARLESGHVQSQTSESPTVVILGLARQGTALARFFATRGWHVVVSDQQTEEALRAEMAELADLEIAYVLGGHPLSLLASCDLLCLSGGVPLTLPVVKEAMRKGIPLSNDAQEFLARSPAPVIGITGSAGKTTTTTLVGSMLEASGLRTWVGGNIGNPLIGELANIQPSDRVVMELSSFQLELMDVSPHVAGVLNITPNHLDRHKTMDAYIAAKRHIVAYQNADDIAVLGYDDANARAFAAETPANIWYFSLRKAPEVGAFLHGDCLMLRDGAKEVEIARRDAVRLRGMHNIANTLAAIALARAAGASVAGIRSAIGAFKGVAHRLEEVCSQGGVLWVNDSIATAPERVLAALDAFDEPMVLLAGGRDKDLPWDLLAERIVQGPPSEGDARGFQGRVRVLVLFGEAAPLIESQVTAALERARETGSAVALERMIMTGSLQRGVKVAAREARPGDVVLLSPGGTSFDAFRDFEERGERFREWARDVCSAAEVAAREGEGS